MVTGCPRRLLKNPRFVSTITIGAAVRRDFAGNAVSALLRKSGRADGPIVTYLLETKRVTPNSFVKSSSAMH